MLTLLVLTSPLAAQQRIGREQTLHRTTRAGEPVRVFTYTSWDSGCNPNPAPQIVIRTPPRSGTISIQPGNTEVRVLGEGAPADCTGHIMPGTAVYYSPGPGFHGVDQFDYDVLEGRTTRHDTATIEVR